MTFLNWTFLSILLIMSKANHCIAWKTERTNDVLFVYDVLIENQSDPVNLNFTKLYKVSLKRPKITTLTLEMQSQITDVSKLELLDGSVPAVHVAPHFKELVVIKCATSEVIIRPDIAYSLEKLYITHNMLKKLPEHLGALTNLKELHLHNNQIEFVDMADFNGLNRLEKIHLSSNKILEISANSVVLPSLLEVHADDNRLSSINFEHWNTASLKKIDLRRNRLSIALAIQNAFPNLRAVFLSGNPFNCEWLLAALKELETRRVKISDKGLTTCSQEAKVPDEFRKSKSQNTFATKQEMQNTNNKRDVSVESIKTLQDSLNLYKQSQQRKISELEKSFQQFQKVILAEIEQLKHQTDERFISMQLKLSMFQSLVRTPVKQVTSPVGT